MNMQREHNNIDEIQKIINPALTRYPTVFCRGSFMPIFEHKLVMDFGVKSSASDKLTTLMQAADAVDHALRDEGYVVEECSFGFDGFKLTVCKS